MLTRLLVNIRKMSSTITKLLIFIVLASLALEGCLNTQGTLQLNGKVSDIATEKGIPLKRVIIKGILNKDDKQELIEAGQFCTDSTGSFSYLLRKIKGSKSYNFFLVGDSDYLFKDNYLSLFDLENRGVNLTFSMEKLTDLTIKIERICKIPDSDTLLLCWDSNGVFGLSLYPFKINNYGKANKITSAVHLIWIGGTVNSIVTTRVFAGKRAKLNWELLRNGRRMEYEDTITCKRDINNVVVFRY